MVIAVPPTASRCMSPPSRAPKWVRDSLESTCGDAPLTPPYASTGAVRARQDSSPRGARFHPASRRQSNRLASSLATPPHTPDAAATSAWQAKVEERIGTHRPHPATSSSPSTMKPILKSGARIVVHPRTESPNTQEEVTVKRRAVSFFPSVLVAFTYAPSEYDRTSVNGARLTNEDVREVLDMRRQFHNFSQSLYATRAAFEAQINTGAYQVTHHLSYERRSPLPMHCSDEISSSMLAVHHEVPSFLFPPTQPVPQQHIHLFSPIVMHSGHDQRDGWRCSSGDDLLPHPPLPVPAATAPPQPSLVPGIPTPRPFDYSDAFEMHFSVPASGAHDPSAAPAGKRNVQGAGRRFPVQDARATSPVGSTGKMWVVGDQ